MSKDKDSLEITMQEKAVNEIAKNFIENSRELKAHGQEEIDGILRNVKILDNEKKQAVSTNFLHTVISTISETAECLSNQMQKGNGVLFNAVLSESAVSVIESILDFKNTVDKICPGMTDTIMELLSPVITKVMVTVYPPIGIILKSTDLLNKVTKLLNTENLEKSLKNINDRLNQIDNDKVLRESAIMAQKLNDLADITKTNANSLHKMNISKEEVETLIKVSQRNVLIQEFIQEGCEYCKEAVQTSRKGINERMNLVKLEILDNIKNNVKDGNKLNTVINKIEETFKQAEKSLVLIAEDRGSKFFQKIEAQQIASCNIMIGVNNVINNYLSKEMSREIKEKILSDSKKIISDKIRGPIGKLEKMIKDPTISDISKKLGASIASQISINRASDVLEKNLGHAK